MTHSLTIQQAQLSDANAILSILNEACDWLTAKGIDQWAPGRFSRERSLAAIDRGEVCVAKIGAEIVGTLRLTWADEALWIDGPALAGYVHVLAVTRARAGTGVGVAMLRWTEEQVAAAGRKYLRLDCMAANVALREYYLRTGFRFVGEAGHGDFHAALFEREAGSRR